MKYDISQQVSATYARNNFSKVNNEAMEEGMRVIVRKSKPVTVILSVEKYKKLQESPKPKKKKKFDLEEIRKNDIFSKHAGVLDKKFGNISSVKIAKKWTDYVD